MAGKKITAADFFAGIGGMGLGFKQAGFNIVYSNDFDERACETYRKNCGEIDCKDIKKIKIKDIPDFDVFLGGFPCQPYSMIGKRLGLDDERGKIFFQITRILKTKKPRAFVLENVKNLVNYKNGSVLKKMTKALEKIGYGLHLEILDSKDFGVPQNRKRLYIIGLLNKKKISVSYKKKKKSKLKDILEKNAHESYYLSEKYYKGLLEHKKRHKKSGNGFGCAVLNIDGLSNTLVAGNMGRERNLIKDKKTKKNKFGIRRLTIRECARLQGFPDSFVLPDSATTAYKQLGNAVTVPVAKAVAVNIRKMLKN